MNPPRTLRAGMAGLGMIFDETYRPFFEAVRPDGLFQRSTGLIEVELTAAATRTGTRGEKLKQNSDLKNFINCHGPSSVDDLLKQNVDVVCVATPDDRHFEPAKKAILAGKHVLIEKPSVLSLKELEVLTRLATEKKVLAKVVYHKLLDPDHKKLRTLVTDGILKHVNNGYCSLLEPKSVAKQFGEWIGGRNPASYVAVHYFKLIDFTFGPDWKLKSVAATGQRGLLENTWDSVQTRLVYEHPDRREAAFDIHTSWVMPDNFPGYVEQEVQFRFDNGVWNASQRKRGVEVCVEPPHNLKLTPNHHYNGTFLEPWGARSQRGYGIEAIRRFFEEVAYVEYGGPADQRGTRLQAMQALTYNDLHADRSIVAAVEAVETLLGEQRRSEPARVFTFNKP